MAQLLENILGRRNAFIAVFLVVTGVLAIGAWSILVYINDAARLNDDLAPRTTELSPIYVNFYRDAEDVVSAESYLAMGQYAQENPLPRNVQVLEGMSTHEINGYMLNHFVAGLNVNCTYCHSLENFAAEEWGDTEEINAAEHNRWVAREHLSMVQDLNQNWLTQLPGLTEEKQPYGSQITCATCHLGQAQFNTYPENRDTLPADFTIPLGEDVVYDTNEQGYLNVTGRVDISLDDTQLNQYVMYHMNASMNVGCTHCHNSRYFPENSVPAKHYSMNMLQMSQYIAQEWGDALIVSPGDEPAVPSCLMCHHEAVIPPGSARNVDVMAPALVPEGSQSGDAGWGEYGVYLDTADEWLEDAAEYDLSDDAYQYDPNDPENTGYTGDNDNNDNDNNENDNSDDENNDNDNDNNDDENNDDTEMGTAMPNEADDN